MASGNNLPEFPDVEAKLSAPFKRTAREKQRAEAEAKQRREAKEYEAAFADFAKSLGHDPADSESFRAELNNSQSRSHSGPPERPAFGSHSQFGGGAGKRHFVAPSGPSLKSGPGSLGPMPTSYRRNRPNQGLNSNRHDRDGDCDRARDMEDNRGRLGFEDRGSRPFPLSKAFDANDDDEPEATPVGRAEEKAAAKPTVRLTNLPPNMSPAAIKALINSSLFVEDVQILPPSRPGGTERKCLTSIVTLAQDTPGREIDAAVSALQSRYLGFGFYLSLGRHLSSTAIMSTDPSFLSSSSTTARPFGAKQIAPSHSGYGQRHRGRNFAPPSSYGGSGLERSGILHVPIQPPRDIKQLRMIHKTLETLLVEGPEFEALLMSHPEVQRDEKWAWIWDARSEGGLWYRWRLWQIMTGADPKKSGSKFVPLFEGGHAWQVPEKPLPFEYVTELNEFVSDSEYNSEEDSDDERQPRDGSSSTNDQEDKFLNPIDKANLTHLLARLPKKTAQLRKGDIARVTAFAITHSSRGADEIAEMVVSNIKTPFSYSRANPVCTPKPKDGGPLTMSRSASPTTEGKASGDTDKSAASLIGLYVVSDVLSASAHTAPANSKVRHAWRYTNKFDEALRRCKTFEFLGGMADRYGWGRLKAEKWKRSIHYVLDVWRRADVFLDDSQSYFKTSFDNCPKAGKQVKADDGEVETEAQKKAGKWKIVEAAAEKDGNSGDLLEVPDVDEDEGDSGEEDDDSGDGEDTEDDGDEDNHEKMDYDDDSADEMPIAEEEWDKFPHEEYSDSEVSGSEEDIDGESLIEMNDIQISDQGNSDGQNDGDDHGTIQSSSNDDVEMGGGRSSEEPSEVATSQSREPSTNPAPARKRMKAADMFDSGSDGGN